MTLVVMLIIFAVEIAAFASIAIAATLRFFRGNAPARRSIRVDLDADAAPAGVGTERG